MVLSQLQFCSSVFISGSLQANEMGKTVGKDPHWNKIYEFSRQKYSQNADFVHIRN